MANTSKAKSKSIYKGASDLWEQALSSVKNLSRFFRTESRDKRTIKSTQRAAKELFTDRKNKEIGEQLGVSYQRVTSIKRQVMEGKAYSPELRDILQSAADEYNDKPRQLEDGIYFFPKRDKLVKSTNHIDTIKIFPELSDATKFWKKVIKSDKFIAITQVGKGDKAFYHVVGLGTRRQRPFKGAIQDKRAKNRIDQILGKYSLPGKHK